MPKTAVNEDDFPVPRQHYIWIARKITLVKAKAIAHLVQETPDDLFRFSVLALYTSHYFASLFGAKSIGHLSYSCG